MAFGTHSIQLQSAGANINSFVQMKTRLDTATWIHGDMLCDKFRTRGYYDSIALWPI